MLRKTKKYSAQFKFQAVHESIKRDNVSEGATDSGVNLPPVPGGDCRLFRRKPATF